MSTPEDTSKRPSIAHYAGMVAEGQEGYITGMEARGQREVVNSEVLPAEILGDWNKSNAEKREAFEELGFEFGETAEDGLFVRATLPEGWTREGSEHAMWSFVVDERGIPRVAVFYKAAFYDRKAHMSMTDPGSEAAASAMEGKADLWPVLSEEERESYLGKLRRSIDLMWRHPSTLDAERLRRAKSLLVEHGDEA